MPGEFLRIRFVDDGDGTGELIANAMSNGFSGMGQAYFNIEDVEKFAGSIADFSVVNELHSIVGGTWKADRRNELEREHLGITVYPIDARGHIGVQVRTAMQIHCNEQPDCWQSATIELLSSHAALVRFSRGLIAVLRANAEDVVLSDDA